MVAEVSSGFGMACRSYFWFLNQHQHQRSRNRHQHRRLDVFRIDSFPARLSNFHEGIQEAVRDVSRAMKVRLASR